MHALRAVGHGLSLEHVLSELHKKTLINRSGNLLIAINCVLPPPHVIFLYYFLFSLSLPLCITRLT